MIQCPKCKQKDGFALHYEGAKTNTDVVYLQGELFPEDKEEWDPGNVKLITCYECNYTGTPKEFNYQRYSKVTVIDDQIKGMLSIEISCVDEVEVSDEILKDEEGKYYVLMTITTFGGLNYYGRVYVNQPILNQIHL